MDNKYIRDAFISSYMIDSSLHFGLYQIVGLFQDLMTEHLTIMKCNGEMIGPENNAFWVVTKLKIQFNCRPMWLSHVKAVTYPSKAQSIRLDRNYAIYDEKENLCIKAKQEMCVLDLQTHKLRRLNSTLYPMDANGGELIVEEPYMHFHNDFTNEDYVYSHEVRLVNIDRSRHCNNVEYVRILMDAFECEDLYDKELVDFEIHYVNEAKEHAKLDVFKKEKEDGYYLLIKQEDKIIVEAFLKIKK